MAYEVKMQDKELEVRYERYKGIIKNFTLFKKIIRLFRGDRLY